MDNTQKHKVIVESLAEAMHILPTVYDEVLNSTFFQGGWAEYPNFSAEDYQKYVGWLKGESELPEDMKGLKKATLIGANKVFGVLDHLSQNVRSRIYDRYRIVAQSGICEERAVQRAIDLRLSDDSSLIVDHAEDPDHYSYKNLYLRSPGQDMVFLRAVSTYNLGELSALNNGKVRRIRTTRKRLSNILETFKRFHKDVNEGHGGYNITLPFDATISLREKE